MRSYPADYFTLNLDAPALNETDPDELLTAFVFGTDTTVIQNAAVAGAWRVRGTNIPECRMLNAGC